MRKVVLRLAKFKQKLHVQMSNTVVLFHILPTDITQVLSEKSNFTEIYLKLILPNWKDNNEMGNFVSYGGFAPSHLLLAFVKVKGQ